MAVVASALLGANQCPPATRVGNDTCLACHTGVYASDKREFLFSPHSRLACERCHGEGSLHVRNGGRGGLFITNPGEFAFAAEVDFCSPCHEDIVEGFKGNAHFRERAVTCNGCHDVHELGGMLVGSPPGTFDSVDYSILCGRCHPTQSAQFLASDHGILDVARCNSCHRLHGDGFVQSPLSNAICLQCHGSFALGFTSEAVVDAHTGAFHPVDPAGSGASRCTKCHMVPLTRFDQADGPHSHLFEAVPPAFTIEASLDGVAPLPPNSCAGVMGCHDPGVPGPGSPHDLDDLDELEDLQTLFESIGDIPVAP